MIVNAIIYNVGIFFMMMIPGIILKKCNMISDGFGKGLSNLVLYIAQPALIFLAYVRDFDKEILINSLYVFIFSIISHTLFSVVAIFVFKKAPDSRARMLKFVKVPISRFKTGFDCVFAAFGIILSFSFYGLWQFEGVKIGTLFCAVCNGSIIGWIGNILDRRFDFPARWTKFQKYFI